MTLKVMGTMIEAEGKEMELAIYTHALINIFIMQSKLENEQEAKREAESMGEFLSKTFSEMLKRECGEDEGEG